MPFVVVLARGIQSSRLGCYGAAWSLTPNIDRLASQSLVFDQFLIENTDPQLWGFGLRDTPTIWMGPTPPDNKSKQIKVLPALSDDPKKIHHEMEMAWDTVFQSAAKVLVVELTECLPPWSPSKDDLDAYFPTQEAKLHNDSNLTGTTTDPEIHNEKDEIRTTDEQSQFPWLTDLPRANAISPMQVENYRGSFLLTHSAAIASTDRKLGYLLEFLASRQTTDTHLIFTSDIGIALGEKNHIGHGGGPPWLDPIQVPLIWCHPERQAYSLRHSALLGGEDLNEFLNSNPISPTGLIESSWKYPREKGQEKIITTGQGESKSVRTRNWGLVLDNTGQASLYEFPIDHWEINNLSNHNPGVLTLLAQQLEKKSK